MSARRNPIRRLHDDWFFFSFVFFSFYNVQIDVWRILLTCPPSGSTKNSRASRTRADDAKLLSRSFGRPECRYKKAFIDEMLTRSPPLLEDTRWNGSLGLPVPSPDGTFVHVIRRDDGAVKPMGNGPFATEIGRRACATNLEKKFRLKEFLHFKTARDFRRK